MRADRLLSLMMLLQSRGQMTAGQLAVELGVSVRTVYRDLDALSTAGVPVYTSCGPHGGCGLVEGYRTTLTGMTPAEARALFMLSIPAPLAQLGMADELRSALRKLAAALPTARLSDEERVRQRFHLDALGWFQGAEPVPHLQTVYRAVWEDRCLRLKYRLFFAMPIEQVVAPYGLVAKAGIWYAVCGLSEEREPPRMGAGTAASRRLRVQRVAELLDAQICEETFTRPPGFDLAAFWADWCADYERDRPSYPTVLRMAPRLVAELPRFFGEAAASILAAAEPAEPHGWLKLTLPFETFESARERILSFGGAVEVLAPEALRCSVADFAAQTCAIYAKAR